MKKILVIVFGLLLLVSCTRNDFQGEISVTGNGSVFITPDTAGLTISIEERARTTKEAQDLTNMKMQEVISALKNAGVEERAIKTSRINFENEQEWNEESRRYIITGQIVTQSLNVKFENLISNPRLLAATLDTLGSINGIQIGNLTFSIKDTTEQYIEARRLAFSKAMQKAQELADYAGVTLGKAVRIIESQAGGSFPMAQSNLARSYETSAMNPGELPGGEIEISVIIDTVFETY